MRSQHSCVCSGVDKTTAYRTRSSYRTQSLPKILHKLTFTSVDRPFEEAATAASPPGARRRRSLMTAPMAPQSSPDMLPGQRSGYRNASMDGASRGWHQTRSTERMHILPASYSAGSASAPDMKVHSNASAKGFTSCVPLPQGACAKQLIRFCKAGFESKLLHRKG